MRPRHPSSIRDDVMRVSLILVLATVVLSLGGTLFLAIHMEQDRLDSNLMNSARVIARVPAVAHALEREVSQADLAFLDQSVAAVRDIDVIVVADIHNIQYYYSPDRSYVGEPYSGTDQNRILQGEAAYTSNDTGLSGAERCAYAEVRNSDGELLGFVMVGIYLRSVSSIIQRTVFSFLAIGGAALLLGILLSIQLSNKIKQSLMGYEPDAFLHLFHQREDILEALEEGILAIDEHADVIYINGAAAALLDTTPEAAVGRPLRKVYPQSTLDRVVWTGQPEYNVDMVSMASQRQVRVLSDRMPIRENNRVVGAVAIFRNRTELTRLAEDLTGVRHMVDAMRAYTHEFMNKLHVILGLLQIGEPERAEQYIMDTTRIQHEAVSRIMAQIEDPSAAALLVGKTSRASERGIQLILEPGSHLSGEERYLPSAAYVTILGNLIENAIDSLNQGVRGEKEIRVTIREEEQGLLLCVEDTGPGIPPELQKDLFRRGVSSKGAGHGTGLFLVKSVTDTYHGVIRVESEPEVGTAIFISFHAQDRAH